MRYIVSFVPFRSERRRRLVERDAIGALCDQCLMTMGERLLKLSCPSHWVRILDSEASMLSPSPFCSKENSRGVLALNVEMGNHGAPGRMK